VVLQWDLQVVPSTSSPVIFCDLEEGRSFALCFLCIALVTDTSVISLRRHKGALVVRYD
jgi:hypothetical protein